MKGTEQQLHCLRRSGNYKLSWSIIKKAHAYKGGGKGKCDLCLTENIYRKYLQKSFEGSDLQKSSDLLSSVDTFLVPVQALIRENFLRCLHLLSSSVLLIKHPFSLALFRISSFSVKHRSFTNERYRTTTTLSQKIWELQAVLVNHKESTRLQRRREGQM